MGRMVYCCIGILLISGIFAPASFAGELESEIQLQVRGLESQDREVREAAAKALVNMGEDALPALSALVKALKDKNEVVSYRASKALSNLGAPAVSPLAEAMASSRTAVRKNAADALKTMVLKDVDCSAAISALMRGLGDASARVETRSSAALVAMDEAAVPALIKGLVSQDAAVRKGSAASLGKIGPGAGPAAPYLAKGLKDKEAVVRAACARALGKIGPEAKSAIPSLAAAMADQDVELRCRAIEVLGAIAVEEETPVAISHLVAGLGDGSQRVRSRAADSLTRLGAPAVPELVGLLESRDGEQRAAAAATLGKIGPSAKGASRSLAAGLKDSESGVRRACAIALGKVGPEAGDAVPPLMDALSDEDVEVRCVVVETLSGMPAEEPGLIEALINSMVDESSRVGTRARKAIVRWGPVTAPYLAVCLNNNDYKVSIAAAKALQQIDECPDAAIQSLLDALNSGIPEVRETAVVVLGRIGPGAKDAALPALRKLKETDRNSSVRRRVDEVIMILEEGDLAPQ